MNNLHVSLTIAFNGFFHDFLFLGRFETSLHSGFSLHFGLQFLNADVLLFSFLNHCLLPISLLENVMEHLIVVLHVRRKEAPPFVFFFVHFFLQDWSEVLLELNVVLQQRLKSFAHGLFFEQVFNCLLRSVAFRHFNLVIFLVCSFLINDGFLSFWSITVLKRMDKNEN